ncbi:MAG: hypothetical protein LBV74_00225 [Tannerella sp.]|jgi:lipopolysaccharide export system protein LptA|nr:hypothetical protein [Tannerella sp.]
MKNNAIFCFIATNIVLLLSGLPYTMCAQGGKPNTPKKITCQADVSYRDEDNYPGIFKWVDNVKFTHEGTIGYCDSAYTNDRTNNMEAFGNPVKIYINDTVTLYGQYVLYNGNSRVVSISRKVRLEDNAATLYTDTLIYDLNADVGYYLTGGKTVNKENTLTSKRGNYYTKDNYILLKDDVVLVNETYTMTCDSLNYNTENEVVYFISRTHLVSEENEIYTNSGWYETKTDLTLLVDDVELLNESQQIYGDSIFYDKITGLGIGWNNIVIIDTTKDFIIKGNYAEYYEHGGISTVTDSALLILIETKDSLYFHADTFKIHIDSLQDPQILRGYNHVKFFRQDMQGACDSISYILQDSTLTMYHNPVVWSSEYQLTGDTIVFYIIDSLRMEVHIIKSGFIAAGIYENTQFNQIKGISIIGHILDRELTHVDVIGNAECFYYIQEESENLIGINSSVTSEMRINFDKKEIKNLVLYNEPDGTINPDDKISEVDRKLKNFRWLNYYRPQNVDDIFHRPIPRDKESVYEEE